MKYDFSGWATRNNLKCSDGRTIMRNAFIENDGKKVPLMWNHQHNAVDNVLGHAYLENRDEGVYAYGVFNDTEAGQAAKLMVQNGDVESLSIFANKLKQDGSNVTHGIIREVSLVLAGANPGAYIEDVISHSDECDGEASIYNPYLITGEGEMDLSHSDSAEEVVEEADTVEHAEGSDENPEGETIADIFNTLSNKQKKAVYYVVGKAIEGRKEAEEADDNEGGNNTMSHNVFENDATNEQTMFLSHADQAEILKIAKSSNCGSLKGAMELFAADHSDTLAHGFDTETMEQLFPDPHKMYSGAPEALPGEDRTWINIVTGKCRKSPFPRVRTRQADVSKIRAGGYKTGHKKTDMANITLVGRTTSPQTIYIKDKLNRDDILDIEDFDVVNYEYGVMEDAYKEEIATAILIGDGREPGDEQKIEPTCIRPIWLDDELYTIHHVVDYDAAKAALQGTNTGASFGDSYIKAEATVEAALFAREQYKGSGALDYFCTPHSLNVMLLARDMNGRRIYNSKADLAAALNVRNIYEVEKFEGLTRKTNDEKPKTRKLLGLFVNMDDYQVGSVKNGKLTKFSQFDIDFNQEKFLMEGRMSGALTRVKSAIALEEEEAQSLPASDSHVA